MLLLLPPTNARRPLARFATPPTTVAMVSDTVLSRPPPTKACDFAAWLYARMQVCGVCVSARVQSGGESVQPELLALASRVWQLLSRRRMRVQDHRDMYPFATEGFPKECARWWTTISCQSAQRTCGHARTKLEANQQPRKHEYTHTTCTQLSCRTKSHAHTTHTTILAQESKTHLFMPPTTTECEFSAELL